MNGANYSEDQSFEISYYIDKVIAQCVSELFNDYNNGI